MRSKIRIFDLRSTVIDLESANITNSFFDSFYRFKTRYSFKSINHCFSSKIEKKSDQDKQEKKIDKSCENPCNDMKN